MSRINYSQTMNEWMNEWMNLFAWQDNTISQAGTPRHDNCVRLPVSINDWLVYVVKTNITNKNCLVIKRTKTHIH